jgi:hypothetical protein
MFDDPEGLFRYSSSNVSFEPHGSAQPIPSWSLARPEARWRGL